MGLSDLIRYKTGTHYTYNNVAWWVRTVDWSCRCHCYNVSVL